MTITAEAVKSLRERTGAGMMERKKALQETAGDLDAAAELMRKQGLAKADKKATRVAAEGIIVIERSTDGKRAAIAEVNCETDFVARTAEFQALLKDIAMQVAAANPRYIRREDVSAAELDKEKEIYRQQALETGKPEKVVEKIVDGKIERFYSEVCLLEQSFIKEPDKKVSTVVNDAIARLGENIQIRRFARYHLGEGAVTE